MIGKIFGQYEVIEKIGQGGMGVVYRGRDTILGREAALKFLPAEFLAEPDRLARFRNEAKVLASLNHANIAAIYGLEEAEGQIFLAMEYVDGEELGDRLKNGPLPLDDALDLARQLAEGLEAAHERGIVHRDLKPANLKLTEEGQLKILDFGLARAYVEDAGESESSLDAPTMTAALTQKGVILGTAAYMSPEQARGRKVDHRTDIWAFGAILYEMLTGIHMFAGETISDTVAAVLRADLDLKDLPDETPEAVRRLIKRCLERDARRRLRDIGEARVRLERWQEDPEALNASVSMLGSDLVGSRSRLPLLPWLVAGAAICVAVVLGWMLLQQSPPVPRLSDWAIEVVGEDELNTDVNKSVLISPDGNWYGWKTQEGIHLRRVGSRDVKLLPGTPETTAACFSPDSRWIAFMSRGQLNRINVEGGDPFRVCEAPNSRGVAWVSENILVISDGISTGLRRVDISNGENLLVTLPDSTMSERSHRWPTAVPGRNGVLYECQFAGQNYDTSDIRYLDLESGTSKTILRGGAAPQALASGHLLFVRGHTLYATGLDLDGMEVRGQPIAVREDLASSVGNQEDDDGSAEFSIDEHGTLFYVDMMGGIQKRSRLAWLDYASATYEPITDYAEYGDFEISPDGLKLVVTINRDGDYNLYVLDLVAKTELLLTNRNSVEYMGTWSPDSKRFYWSQSSDNGNHYEVWSRLVDGSQPAQHVVDAVNLGGGVWPRTVSEDGRWLSGGVFAGGNQMDLFMMDLENPELGIQEFISGPDVQINPNFMASGRYLVYGSGEYESFQFLVRRYPDTGAVWSLPSSESGWYQGSWVPGLGNVMAMDDRGLFEIPITLGDETVTVGSPIRKLSLETDPQRRLIQDLRFHPEGKRAIVRLQESSGGDLVPPSLVVVTGWEQDMIRRLKAAGI